MTEHEFLFKEIQSLSGPITASLRGDTFKMGRDEVNLVGSIYKRITSGKRLNLACAECVKNAINYIHVWYEKEIVFHQATKTNGHVKSQVEAEKELTTNKKKKK